MFQMRKYDDIWARLCSATLIRPQVLLSAGHCFTMLEALDYEGELYITFNQDAVPEGVEFDPEQDDEYLAVAGYVYPEEIFEDMDDPKDIALVFLAESVPDEWGIGRQNLPTKDFLDILMGDIKGRKETNFTVVGYGAQGVLDWPYKMLDAVRKSATVVYKYILPYKLATFQNWDDGQLCHGDLGGPIFYNDGGNEIMVGLLGGIEGGNAWGCTADFFHYRLDKESTLNWINDELDKLK